MDPDERRSQTRRSKCLCELERLEGPYRSYLNCWKDSYTRLYESNRPKPSRSRRLDASKMFVHRLSKKPNVQKSFIDCTETRGRATLLTKEQELSLIEDVKCMLTFYDDSTGRSHASGRNRHTSLITQMRSRARRIAPVNTGTRVSSSAMG